MDIDNLSVAEIKDLQLSLQNRLKQKENDEKNALIDAIRSLVDQSPFDMDDVVEVLQRGLTAQNIQYQHPADPSQTWSGRGRMPHWLHQEIDKGKQKEDFLLEK